MNTMWRKVLGDLREYRAQAILVSIAILISVVAVLTAFGAEEILSREVRASYLSGQPAAIVIWLDAVDEELLAAVHQRSDVEAADARRLVRARAEVAPGDWRTLFLFGVRDFADMRVSLVRSESGNWPPSAGAGLVERSALPVLQVEQGGRLHVRVPGGAEADLPVSGIVYDSGVAPGWQDNAGYLYVSTETLAQLGQGDYLDELRITVGNDVDRAQTSRIAAELSAWLAAEGYIVQRVEVPVREHPHAIHMETMLLILQVFSGLALLLSGALIANMMAGLLTRQVRQIGILKSIGATSRQVALIYLTFIGVLALAAVAIGAPLGTLLARAFARFAAGQLNLEITSYAIPPGVYAAIIAVGLSWPLLMAAFPVWRAVRRTARAAMQDTGIEMPKASSPNYTLSRFAVDQSTTLALRNTFRRPVRLMLTLLSLALGGAMLLTAVNVYQGLIAAVDNSLAERGDDVDVRLLGVAPVDAVSAAVADLPGVEYVEAWGGVLAAVEIPAADDADGMTNSVLAGEKAGETHVASEHVVGTGRYSLLAPPPETELLNLPMVEGRWPAADEVGAVVVNRTLQADEPALQLGAEVALLVVGRETTVRVVGVTEDVSPPTLYTNPATLDRAVGQSGTAGTLRIVTEPGAEASVATAVEETLIDNGWFPSFLMTRQALRTSMIDHFLILLSLLSLAALAAVAVGALGLSTSMSLNVLERTREIGITRSMGATAGKIRQIILTEGAAITALSLILAVLLSIPLSAGVSYLIGKHGLYIAVPLVISPLAIGTWVFVAAVVTTVACLVPARRAMRLPVQEVLLYE